MMLWFRHVYMDHNASTHVADDVVRSMTKVLKSVYGNPSSLHTKGRSARGMVDEARRSVAALLECEPEKLLFTSGGTETNNTVIKGLFSQAGGGHIITSAIEHESVLGACRQVEQKGGRVDYLKAGPDGRVNPADVRAAIRPDTILISIMHANNETGAVQPIQEIARIAESHKIPFHTDAVQTFGKIPVLPEAWGVEFLTLNAHKIGGPKGVGALYWRGKTSWVPLIAGGDQEGSFRAGTEGVAQIVGLGAAAKLAAKDMRRNHENLKALRRLFEDGLKRTYPTPRLNEACPECQMPGTLSVEFPGREGIRLLAGLDCYGVSVSIGSACTADRIEPSHVLLGMGIEEKSALSTIRISMGRTTTPADVRYVLAAVRKVLHGDPAGFSYMPPEHLTTESIRSGDKFLIDLRFPYERMISPSLPGAKEWSHIFFERYFKHIPRDKDVVLMCATGLFSMMAGYRLSRSGHKRVKVVYGGFSAWKALHPRFFEEDKKS